MSIEGQAGQGIVEIPEVAVVTEAMRDKIANAICRIGSNMPIQEMIMSQGGEPATILVSQACCRLRTAEEIGAHTRDTCIPADELRVPLGTYRLAVVKDGFALVSEEHPQSPVLLHVKGAGIYTPHNTQTGMISEEEGKNIAVILEKIQEANRGLLYSRSERKKSNQKDALFVCASLAVIGLLALGGIKGVQNLFLDPRREKAEQERIKEEQQRELAAKPANIDGTIMRPNTAIVLPNKPGLQIENYARYVEGDRVLGNFETPRRIEAPEPGNCITLGNTRPEVEVITNAPDEAGKLVAATGTGGGIGICAIPGNTVISPRLKDDGTIDPNNAVWIVLQNAAQ